MFEAKQSLQTRWLVCARRVGAEMEHVKSIQEIIDDHKESMPTGVATRVMKECQRLHDIHSKLYRLTWTTVASHAYASDEDEPVVKLVPLTQTLIVEAVDEAPIMNQDGDRLWHGHMPNKGLMMAQWLKMDMPYIINPGGDLQLIIVHSIEPFVKRPREE